MNRKLKQIEKQTPGTVKETHVKKKLSGSAGRWKNTSDVAAVNEAIERLRGSVISYKDPFKPIGVDHWEALK